MLWSFLPHIESNRATVSEGQALKVVKSDIVSEVAKTFGKSHATMESEVRVRDGSVIKVLVLLARNRL